MILLPLVATQRVLESGLQVSFCPLAHDTIMQATHRHASNSFSHLCCLTGSQQALEQFSTDAADTENDPAKESIFDEKVRTALDTYTSVRQRVAVLPLLSAWL